MKVRIVESVAGHADENYALPDNFSFRPGEIVELDDDLAAAWIASGTAAVVDEVAPQETKETKKASARAPHASKG